MESQERNNYFRMITCCEKITECVRCVFEYHLQKKNQTLEDFINYHQHDIYHSCYTRIRCCQCKKGPFNPGGVKSVLHEEQLQILFDPYVKCSCHNNAKSQKFCCSKARSGVILDDLDLTLLGYLMTNFCLDFFWESCLEGDTFDKFLNNNKHTIYHLWKANMPCCECFSGYKYPCERENISEADWKILYGSPGNPCPLHNIIITHTLCCCVSATKGLLPSQVNNKIQVILLETLCNLWQCLKRLIDLRNEYSHPAQYMVKQEKFEDDWTEVKDRITSFIRCGIGEKEETEKLMKDHTEKLEAIKTLQIDYTNERRKKKQVSARNEIERRIKETPFIETRSLQEAKRVLDKYNIVILTGYAGEGKSRTAIELLKYYNGHVHAEPLIIYHLEEFSSLIDTCSPTCVLLEDLFGRTNFTFDENCGTSVFNEIKTCIHNGNVKLILTIRSSIFASCEHILMKAGIGFQLYTVDLSRKFLLSSQEKQAMLNEYLLFNNIEVLDVQSKYCATDISSSSMEKISVTKKFILDVVNVETFNGFPEACRLFCSNKEFTLLGLQFFKHPTCFIFKEIEDIRRSGKSSVDLHKAFCNQLRYVTLVYILLNNDILQSYSVDLERFREIMDSVYGTLSMRFSERDILDAVHDMTPVYLIHRNDTYRIQHRILSEAVMLSYSTCDMTKIIEIFNADFIAEMVKPQSYVENTGEVVLKIPEKYYNILVKVFQRLIEKSDDISFVKYILAKSGMVLDFKFLHDFIAELEAQELDNKRNNDFLGIVLIRLSTNPNFECIQIVWQYLMSYCDNCSRLISAFVELEKNTHEDNMELIFRNSTTKFKERLFYRYLDGGIKSCFLQKIIANTISECKNISEDKIKLSQLLCKTACLTSNKTILQLMFKDAFFEENALDLKGNIKEYLEAAFENVKDDDEIVALIFTKFYDDFSLYFKNAFDIAGKCNNTNVVRYLLTKAKLSSSFDFKSYMSHAFETGNITLAEMLMEMSSIEERMLFDVLAATRMACKLKRFEVISWVFRNNCYQSVFEMAKQSHSYLCRVIEWTYNRKFTSFLTALSSACCLGDIGLQIMDQDSDLHKYITVDAFKIIIHFNNSKITKEFIDILLKRELDFIVIINELCSEKNVEIMNVLFNYFDDEYFLSLPLLKTSFSYDAFSLHPLLQENNNEKDVGVIDTTRFKLDIIFAAKEHLDWVLKYFGITLYIPTDCHLFQTLKLAFEKCEMESLCSKRKIWSSHLQCCEIFHLHINWETWISLDLITVMKDNAIIAAFPVQEITLRHVYLHVLCIVELNVLEILIDNAFFHDHDFFIHSLDMKNVVNKRRQLENTFIFQQIRAMECYLANNFGQLINNFFLDVLC